MADLSKDQLNELVARATKSIVEEMKTGEAKTFGVAELQSHLADLGKQAWEITYKTSHAGIDVQNPLLRPGGTVAWEISYKTSKAFLDRDIAH